MYKIIDFQDAALLYSMFQWNLHNYYFDSNISQYMQRKTYVYTLMQSMAFTCVHQFVHVYMPTYYAYILDHVNAQAYKVVVTAHVYMNTQARKARCAVSLIKLNTTSDVSQNKCSVMYWITNCPKIQQKAFVIFCCSQCDVCYVHACLICCSKIHCHFTICLAHIHHGYA